MKNSLYYTFSTMALCMLLATGCRSGAPVRTAESIAAHAPAPPPARWVGLIGEFGPDEEVRTVLERDGALVLHSRSDEHELVERGVAQFELRGHGALAPVTFAVGMDGRATILMFSGVALDRRQSGPESGGQLLVPPVRPLDELRREAAVSTPPVEAGPFLPTDLVELTKLDSTIQLDIRYATSNNLFGAPFYTQARAFLQRRVAEAVVRANAALRPLGYGILVHDGYRPWTVTKMFWEAAPMDKRIFFADPAEGSKHNRGAAVDLTLYELRTGRAVEMPGTYDETTNRSYSDYPGGTSRQRWHRALLRRAMEAERFVVDPLEWWHFDHADWRRYSIGNMPFEGM